MLRESEFRRVAKGACISRPPAITSPSSEQVNANNQLCFNELPRTSVLCSRAESSSEFVFAVLTTTEELPQCKNVAVLWQINRVVVIPVGDCLHRRTAVYANVCNKLPSARVIRLAHDAGIRKATKLHLHRD